MFIIEILFCTATPTHLHTISSYFHTRKPELSKCDRDCMDCKTTYFLALYKKSLPTSGLEGINQTDNHTNKYIFKQSGWVLLLFGLTQTPFSLLFTPSNINACGRKSPQVLDNWFWHLACRSAELEKVSHPHELSFQDSDSCSYPFTLSLATCNLLACNKVDMVEVTLCGFYTDSRKPGTRSLGEACSEITQPLTWVHHAVRKPG